MAPISHLSLFLLCSSPLFAEPLLTHDPQGRLTREEYSDGTVVVYVLDSNGNILDEQVTKPVELILLINPPGSGTVTGAGRFQRNTTQVLTATAGGAFDFVAWERSDGTVLSTNPAYMHPITGLETITAAFIPIQAPQITAHPSSAQLIGGAPLNLSVTATGRGPFTYQWRHNGELLADTAASLGRSITSFLNAGTYTAEVSGRGGTTTSLEALVTIPIQSYATWRETIFTPTELAANDASIIGPSAIIGNDGMSNLLHFALGARSRDEAPIGAYGLRSAGRLPATSPVFEYNRLLGNPGLHYRLNVSSDLLNWDASNEITEEAVPPLNNPDGLTARVTLRLRQPSQFPRAFFQLSVSAEDDGHSIFEEAFPTETLDSTKWTTSGTDVLPGRSPLGFQGNFSVRTLVEGAGGVMRTLPIPMDQRLPIQLTRDVWFGYASTRSFPSLRLEGTAVPISVYYCKITTPAAGEVARDGIYICRNGANPMVSASSTDVFGPITLDKFVTWREDVVYQPKTGLVTYYKDEIPQLSVNVGTAIQAPSATLRLALMAEGSTVTPFAHSQATDNINLRKFASQDTVPIVKQHIFAEHFTVGIDSGRWITSGSSAEWNQGRAWVRSLTSGAYGSLAQAMPINVDLHHPFTITIVNAVTSPTQNSFQQKKFTLGSMPAISICYGNMSIPSDLNHRVVNGIVVTTNNKRAWLAESDGFRSAAAPFLNGMLNTEIFRYSPVTGYLSLRVNGVIVLDTFVGFIPVDSPQTLKIEFDAAGLGVGQAQLIDRLYVDQ